MPDNPNIFFSIIVPAFNAEKYIDRAISSILNQDFQDFELIVVNDGSTDNTADIINEYINQNTKITVVTHQKNESLHVARMDGVAAVNGKYVLFLDADDYFTDNALSILYNEIQKNPMYDFYEFGYIEKPSDKKVFPFFSGIGRFSAFFEEENYSLQTMWNKVYDVNLLKNAFLKMERIFLNNVEDLYESIIIAYYVKRIYSIKKIITNYVIGTGISTTHKNYSKTVDFLKSIQTMLKLVDNYIKNNKLNIILDNLQYRLMELTINHHINSQKDKYDMEKLFIMLPDFFDIKLIMEYLFYREEAYKEISSVSNSKYFKYFKHIIQQLRKIKKLFV